MLVLICQAGGQRYALDPRDVTEVAPRVELHALAGSPDWIAGLCVYRGQMTPVADLSYLTTGSRCPTRWSNRILMVTADTAAGPRLCGLLVESVTTARLPDAPSQTEASDRSPLSAWGPVLLDDQGMLQRLEIPRLLPPERWQRLSLPAVEQA